MGIGAITSVAVLLALAIVVFDRPEATAGSSSAIQPLQVLPPRLQQAYDSSCRGCHEATASVAPQRGDIAAWTPRLAQGPDFLLGHTMNGYRAMPPLGACMQCDEDDLRQLIAYLTAAHPR